MGSNWEFWKSVKSSASELIEEIKVCHTLDELPHLDDIKAIPRGIKLIVKFSEAIDSYRAQIGEKWKSELPDFSIGIHAVQSEINIVKLISEEEVEANQDFFEQCAKDYRNLSTRLINEFVNKFKINVNPDFPMDDLNPSQGNSYKQFGKMGEWNYFFHGIHCGFTNLKTGQRIEVPLSFGLEFGELDPYFFSEFINSTKEYKPLPLFVYSYYWDGKRILDKMVELGKFEIINSNYPNQTGVVVKDRDKVVINTINSESQKFE